MQPLLQLRLRESLDFSKRLGTRVETDDEEEDLPGVRACFEAANFLEASRAVSS